MKFERDIENLEGPWMHRDGLDAGIAVEPADVAFLVVEAHEPVHGCDRRECGLDRPVHLGRRRSGNGDLDERPEQRARAADHVGLRGCHDQYPA